MHPEKFLRIGPGGSEVWVYRGSRVRSHPVPVVLSVYQRGSLLDGLAVYLSCDTKKFNDNESSHILHNFWTSTHRGEASPLPLTVPLPRTHTGVDHKYALSLQITRTAGRHKTHSREEWRDRCIFAASNFRGFVQSHLSPCDCDKRLHCCCVVAMSFSIKKLNDETRDILPVVTNNHVIHATTKRLVTLLNL